MYIVTIDRPYYPSVIKFEDYDKAQSYYNEVVKYENKLDGSYNVEVTLSKIDQILSIKTNY